MAFCVLYASSPGLGTVYAAVRSFNMELFTNNFTDFLEFESPVTEMWLAPTELFEFASIVAQDMLTSNPDLVQRGICVAIYDAHGTAVSMAPLGTVH